MTHVTQRGPDPSGFFEVVKKGPKLGLSSGQDDNLGSGTRDLHVAIVERRCGVGIYDGCMLGSSGPPEKFPLDRLRACDLDWCNASELKCSTMSLVRYANMASGWVAA
jgi:hypothetical protein